MQASAYITLDPEFEEILAKVAAEPGSSLLRVARPLRIRAFFDREGTGRESRLSSAEKHLLHAYRWEVARLLLDVCRMKLLDHPRSGRDFSPYKNANQPHERPVPATLAERVRRERDDAREVEGLATTWALLERCVAEPFGDEPTVSELAEASFRLVPTNDARLLAAADLIERGAQRAATRLMHRVVAEHPGDDMSFHAWNNLGMAHSTMDDLPVAHGYYVRACSVHEDRIEPWLNRLVLGLQLGLLEDARESCEVIDRLIEPDHNWIGSFSDLMSAQRSAGVWSPSRDSRAILAKLGSRVGPTARRIAVAFG